MSIYYFYENNLEHMILITLLRLVLLAFIHHFLIIFSCALSFYLFSKMLKVVLDGLGH